MKKVPDTGRGLKYNPLSKRQEYATCNRDKIVNRNKDKIVNRNNPGCFKCERLGKIFDTAILNMQKSLRKTWVN